MCELDFNGKVAVPIIQSKIAQRCDKKIVVWPLLGTSLFFFFLYLSSFFFSSRQKKVAALISEWFICDSINVLPQSASGSSKTIMANQYLTTATHSPPPFSLAAFCPSFTNKSFFKFQWWPLRAETVKNFIPSSFLPATAMLFKKRACTHSAGGRVGGHMIDTAVLARHVMEIHNESVLCRPINSPSGGGRCKSRVDEKKVNSALSSN